MNGLVSLSGDCRGGNLTDGNKLLCIRVDHGHPSVKNSTSDHCPILKNAPKFQFPRDFQIFPYVLSPGATGRERKGPPTFWHQGNVGGHSRLPGWTVRIGSDANPRSLRNFPCQANGAEMLRLACCLASERGPRLSLRFTMP